MPQTKVADERIALQAELTAKTVAASSVTEGPPVQAPVDVLPAWTPFERVAFRFSFLFIVQLLIPFRALWYERPLGFRSLKEIYTMGMGLGIHYVTFPGESGRWGIGSFASWGVAALIAAAGAAIWTWFARKSTRTEYNKLNYWLRLAVRYWVALLTMEYGYYKVFPMQMPFPSISNLHSLFGEHAAYRLYWQGVGIVTWYEVFLGVMEVTAGALVLFRATTAAGAFAIMVVMYNVTHGNLAYDGGVHLLSGQIVLLSAFLFAPYAVELWKLLVKREDVVPYSYYPVFRNLWTRYAFNGTRALFLILLIPLYFFDTYQGYYHTNRSKEPRAPGLTTAAGYYNVTEFRLNGKEIPYSPLDPVRWQDVVFEDYPTFTYKVNHAWKIRLDNQSSGFRDAEKRYELAGFAGGRRYFHYSFDQSKHLLYLEDKSGLPGIGDSSEKASPALQNRPANTRGRGRGNAAAKDTPVKMVWHYDQPSSTRIILSGKDEKSNEIYAVLDLIDELRSINIAYPVEGEPLDYRPWPRRYPTTDASFDGKQTLWDRPSPRGGGEP
jgi:hypothetical protein